MTEKPETTPDIQAVLADLRQTLNPVEAETEVIDVATETIEVTDPVTEVLEQTEVVDVAEVVEVVEDTAPIADWRSAESAIASETETIVVDSLPEETSSLPVSEAPTAAFTPEPPLAPPVAPVPPASFGNTTAPTWTAPASVPAKTRPVRVGLLVWAGILLIGGLLILSQLIFPFTSGRILLVVLLAAFGLILIIAALASGVKASRAKSVPK